MSASRIPGPFCAEAQLWSAQDGTAALLAMPMPDWFCAEGLAFRRRPYWQMTVPPDVSFLFRTCLAPKRGITDADWEAAAVALSVERAAIQAVAEVESLTSPFDDLGRPTILFERHYFHDLTQGRYDTIHPRISNATGGGYGKFSAQYGKLEEAFALDPEAALKSASWGRFQIMGKNHRAAGHPSAAAMVKAMAAAETAHLDAFVRFVGSSKAMNAALRDKKWASFARLYNGPGYKKNAYDTKMAAAYGRLAAPKAAATPAPGRPAGPVAPIVPLRVP